MSTARYTPKNPIEEAMLNILNTIYEKMSVSLPDHQHCYSHFADLCCQINRPSNQASHVDTLFLSCIDLNYLNQYNCDSCSFFGKTYTQALTNLQHLFNQIEDVSEREKSIKEAFLWVEYRIEMHRLYNNGLFVLLAPEWEKVNSKPSDLITAIIDEQPIVLIPTYEPTVNNDEEEVKSSSTKTTFSSLFNRKKQGVHQPLLAESSENDADAEYSLDEEVELVSREKPSEDEIPYSALEVESEPVKNKAVTAKTPLLSRY